MTQANPSAPAVIRGATVTEEDGGRLNAFATEPRMEVVDAVFFRDGCAADHCRGGRIGLGHHATLRNVTQL